jgi:deoxyribonuclease-4
MKSKEDAERIGKKAHELGISLSVHAPYYVNLNSSDKTKREATKKRIIDCCRVGEQLGAKVVVFHPGYYSNVAGATDDGNNDKESEGTGGREFGGGKKDKKIGEESKDERKGRDESREKDYLVIKEGVMEMMKEIKHNGWKIKIAPETMGKVNVFGSIEEISKLVKETGCSFTLDFAHIIAREKKVDFALIEKLFPQKEWHLHFSGIEYGEKGERNHKTTTREEWMNLLKNLPNEKDITIINESPTLVDDSAEGLRIYKALTR